MICVHCGIDKPVQDMRYKSRCHDCYKAYMRQYTSANRDEYKTWRRALRASGGQSKCNSCGQSKPSSEMHRKRRCKDCANAYCRAWRAKNREHYNEYMRENAHERRENDPEAAAQRIRVWRSNNPEKMKMHSDKWNHTRRARIQKAPADPSITRAEIYEIADGICAICGKFVLWDDASLDHIIPLSKGGHHVRDNVQLAHLSCNIKKGTNYGL